MINTGSLIGDLVNDLETESKFKEYDTKTALLIIGWLGDINWQEYSTNG